MPQCNRGWVKHFMTRLMITVARWVRTRLRRRCSAASFKYISQGEAVMKYSVVWSVVSPKHVYKAVWNRENWTQLESASSAKPKTSPSLRLKTGLEELNFQWALNGLQVSGWFSILCFSKALGIRRNLHVPVTLHLWGTSEFFSVLTFSSHVINISKQPNQKREQFHPAISYAKGCFP